MRVPVREEAIQRTVIEGLTALGYTVLQTTVRGVRKGYGSTPGVPDLLVTDNDWPDGVWLGVEVKGPTTRLSPAQKELVEAGRVFVVRSWEDALALVKEHPRGHRAWERS